jgi:TonB family protein
LIRIASTIALILSFAAAAAAQDGIIRIPESEARKALISRTDPEYPTMARQMHLSGRVIVDIYIDEDGKVEDAKPVNGNALLSSAAVNAVKRWKFSPIAPGGTPKKAVTSMAFDFKL